LWVAIGVAGCSKADPPAEVDEPEASTTTDTSTTTTTGPGASEVEAVASRLSVRDHGSLYWPTNYRDAFGGLRTIRHVQTGYYGAILDVSDGNLDAFGVIDPEHAPEAVLLQDSAVVGSLPTATLTYSAQTDGPERRATGFAGVGGDGVNPSRVIDMGRFMQRVDIPEVTYAGDPTLAGSVQLAAMTRHFVLSHRVISTVTGPLSVSLEIAGEAVDRYGETDWPHPTRAVAIRDAGGAGWSFVLSEQVGVTSTITRGADGGLTFQVFHPDLAADAPLTLSVIAIPSNAGSDAQRDLWIHPEASVSVQSAQLQRDGSGGEELTEAVWDPERGLFAIDLRDLSEVGAPGWQDWQDPSIHNWYNRHLVRITNHGQEGIAVPLVFEGGNNAAFYIVGGSPLWRDTQGEPIGVPVQISKNWHENPFWYHLYSGLELPAGEHDFELTFAHSKWGSAYAAAHAQLCLIGWGQYQQWDESSLGAFGESITYDPDLTLGRAMVDDVRPFLVDAGGQWGWTGNVGGADFLTYVDGDGVPQRLGRMRTHYAYTGPNLTDVVYAGISADGKVEGRISTQLGRTDDLIRVYYHLSYTFLQDTTYDRLALFQMAADGYADNGFTRYAYGDASEVLLEADVPEHRTTGYASEADRGIPVAGEAPWAMLYLSDRFGDSPPEHLANVGFVVRAYEATIGGDLTTTPHFNITRTYNGGESQIAFELGLPYDPSSPVVPAGSTVEATVEYLVPPSDKSAYYGASDYLLAAAAEIYQSPEMMRRLAADNQLEVSAVAEGALVRTTPVELLAGPGETAVVFTLTGGLGYTPVTVRGLARPDGWRLERQEDGVWGPLGQEVEGNDYWQAYDDPAQGGFHLVFNVHNRGSQTYRLIRVED